jgi:gamma-glutamyltranspeptidase/glutathione hydrolase
MGVVATTHPISIPVGTAALERSGNAFDAAIAIGLAQQVVKSLQAGLGGAVMLWPARARGKAPTIVCVQSIVPATSSAAAFRAMGLSSASADGPLSAVVPDAFGGWLLLRDFGTALGGDGACHRPCRTGSPGRPARPRRPEAVREAVREAAARGEAAGGDLDQEIVATRRARYEGFVVEAVDRLSRVGIENDCSALGPGMVIGAELAGRPATGEARLHIHDGGSWRA